MQKRGRTERSLACEATSLVAWENGRHFTASRYVGCFSQFLTVPSERFPPQSPRGFTAHVAKLATPKIISNSLRAPQWVKPRAPNFAQLEWRNKGVIKKTQFEIMMTPLDMLPKNHRDKHILAGAPKDYSLWTAAASPEEKYFLRGGGGCTQAKRLECCFA